MSTYLTIDVGGTAIKYGLANEDGELLSRGEVPTAKESLEAFVGAISSIVDGIGTEVAGIAMSEPGKTDSARGYLHTGGSLKFAAGMPLASVLSERLGLPVTVENDAWCAALAEMWKGSMQGVDCGAVLVLGTGVGGAFIVDGRLLRGRNFGSGQVSVIPQRWDAPYDRSKVWYKSQGTAALVARYAELCGEDPTTLDGRKVFAALDAGDARARQALDEYCERMACAIYGLQAVLDMDRVAIGGGISRQPELVRTINARMDELLASAPGYPVVRPQIVACTYTSDANMIGALYRHLSLAS